MTRRLDSLWFALALLATWQVLYEIAGDAALSSPWHTLWRAGQMLASPGFWDNVAATFVAFGWAVLLSIVLGLVIGLLLGFSKTAGAVFEPILSTLYAIPKITLYPVILLFFGLGLPAKIAFGTIHGIFPVILLSMNGVRSIRPVIRKTARALSMNSFDTIRTLMLPAALPEIFSGIRIGFALTLLGTLIGELFASNRGIGFLLLRAADQQDVPTTLALILLLFVVAAAAGGGLLAIDRELHRSHGNH